MAISGRGWSLDPHRATRGTAETLHALERMGRENDLAGAENLVAQVGDNFGRVKLFLQEHLEQVAV